MWGPVNSTLTEISFGKLLPSGVLIKGTKSTSFAAPTGLPLLSVCCTGGLGAVIVAVWWAPIFVGCGCAFESFDQSETVIGVSLLLVIVSVDPGCIM